MKKTILLLLLIGVMCLSGCGGQAVAEVNGSALDYDSYEEYMTNLQAIYDANLTAMPDDMSTLVLEQMVYEELIVQSAEEMDCVPTDDEVEAYFQTEMENLYGSYENGMEQLNNFGVSEDFFRHQYRLKLTENNITDELAKTEDVTVSKEEAEGIYTENPQSYNLRKVSQILISPHHSESEATEDYTEAEWETAKNRAEELIEDLQNGADFETLVMKYSDDSATASTGGKLTDVINEENTDYAKSFINGALALTKAGEYSKSPIRTVEGYYILRCDFVLLPSDKQGAVTYIQEETEAQNRSSLLTAYIEEQEEKADIVYHYEKIK